MGQQGYDLVLIYTWWMILTWGTVIRSSLGRPFGSVDDSRRNYVANYVAGIICEIEELEERREAQRSQLLACHILNQH